MVHFRFRFNSPNFNSPNINPNHIPNPIPDPNPNPNHIPNRTEIRRVEIRRNESRSRFGEMKFGELKSHRNYMVGVIVACFMVVLMKLEKLQFIIPSVMLV